MRTEAVRRIVAVVTTDREAVGGGGAPIFYCRNEEERDQVAFMIGRLVDGMAHELANGAYIIVKY